jgi:predicted permease
MTVVGVARAGFTGVALEAPTDIWLPTMMQSDIRYHQNFSADDNGQPEKPWVPQDGISWLDVIVRANGDTARIIGSFDSVYKARLSPPVPGMRLVLDSFASGRSRLRDRFTPTLYALMAMVVLVLIIACANTANLLLARSAARQRELAVRLAIGAGRRRLVQQLLTESVLLACVAAGGGLLLALWSADAIVALVVRSLTGSPTSIIAIDARVLAFTVATSLLTGVVFGLAPVRRAMRLDLSAALKSGGKRAGGTDAAAGKFVIVAQVALSLLLVTAAGLFSRSLYNLAHVELGFQPENVVTIAVNPRTAGVTAEALPALYRRVLDAIVALPTVRSAAWAECELAGGCRSASGGIVVSGYTPAPSEDVTFQENRVSADYLQTLGLRLLRGRNFDASDRRDTRKVAIVNEALVRRYFAGREPIGQRFGYQAPDIEIVGVIANARVYTAREAAEPMAYYPIDQTAQYAASLSVRTAGDPQEALNVVRRALQAAAPNLIIERIATLEQRLDNNLTADRIAAMLAVAFGVLAVVLACVGVYALLSYSVARRTAEIGVRMALGARPANVLRTTLMESLRPMTLGLLIGIPLAAAAGRGASNILFGVEPWDGQVVTAAVVAVLALGVSAAFVPAWRASRVDPLVALRQD